MTKIDKLRSTYPLEIKFFQGEQPTAAKLSAISSQTKAGLNIIEKAIGDIWGTGLSEKGLHHTNLGRVLGDAKYTNPALFNVGARKFFYIENLANKYINKTTGYLTFRPSDKPAGTLGDALSEVKFCSTTNFTQGSTTHATLVAAEKDVSPNEPEFFIGLDGKFRTGKPIEAGDLVGYWVDPTEWIQGAEEFHASIIPDPRSAPDHQFLNIQGDSTTGYFFEVPKRRPLYGNEAVPFSELNNLPERRPMVCSHAIENAVNLNDEANINQAPFFTQVPRFWDTSATADPFHRYNWPGRTTTEGALTSGSIELWDNDANGVVEGLGFAVNVDSTQIDITDTKGRLEYAKGESHEFYLITHGSSISRTLWSLTTALANHDHTGIRYNESNLDHSMFLGLSAAQSKDSTHADRFEWQKSAWIDDDHIQYFHRDGVTSTKRDLNKNAILGDIIIAQALAAIPSDGNYLGDLSAADSYRIFFGDNSATNPNIGAHQDGELYTNATKVTNQIWNWTGTNQIPVGYFKITSEAHVEIASESPTLSLIDSTTNTTGTDFRFKLDEGSLNLRADKNSDGTFDGGNDINFITFGTKTSTSDPLNKVQLHQPLSWDTPLITPDSGEAWISHRVLMEYPTYSIYPSGEDNEIVTTTEFPKANGFRIKMESSPFFDSNPLVGESWLVFEKLWGDQQVPRGGIAFTSNQKEYFTGDHIRKENLLLKSDGTAIFNDHATQAAADTNVTISSWPREIGLDVNSVINATQINTKRPYTTTAALGGNVVEELVQISSDDFEDGISGIYISTVYTFLPRKYPSSSNANATYFLGPDNDMLNGQELTQFQSTPGQVTTPGEYYDAPNGENPVIAWDNTNIPSGHKFWVSYFVEDKITTTNLDVDNIRTEFEARSINFAALGNENGHHVGANGVGVTKGIKFPRKSIDPSSTTTPVGLEHVGNGTAAEYLFNLSTVQGVRPTEAVTISNSPSNRTEVLRYNLNPIMHGQSDSIQVISVCPDEVMTPGTAGNADYALLPFKLFRIDWFRTEEFAPNSNVWYCYVCITNTNPGTPDNNQVIEYIDPILFGTYGEAGPTMKFTYIEGRE